MKKNKTDRKSDWEREFEERFVAVDEAVNELYIWSEDVEDIKKFISNLLSKQREQMVEEVKNLIDEFNEMDNDSAQFEVRIKRPIEFGNKLNKLGDE